MHNGVHNILPVLANMQKTTQNDSTIASEKQYIVQVTIAQATIGTK